MSLLSRAYARIKSTISKLTSSFKTSTMVIYSLLLLLGVGVLYRILWGDPQQYGGSEQNAGREAGPVRVVLYHLPGCPHCTAMMPEWEKLAALHEHDANIKILAVDAKADPVAAARANVEAFPTVVMFLRDGTKLYYDGARTAEAIDKWINHNTIVKET